MALQLPTSVTEFAIALSCDVMKIYLVVFAINMSFKQRILTSLKFIFAFCYFPATTPPPVFGTAGTRRTVYVADDNPDVTLNTKPQSTPLKENPTYLVYNRISTVIGDGACQSLNDRSNNDLHRPPTSEHPRAAVDDNLQERDDVRHDRRAPSRNEKTDNSKESAIWYEYGCV